jgi:hypothetical protein
MPFSPETQQIIAAVERFSGRPVHVEEDASLKTLAQVTPARGVSPAHFVRYQPGNPAADYLVAYQLGFAGRLFSCPPYQRFDLTSTPSSTSSSKSTPRQAIGTAPKESRLNTKPTPAASLNPKSVTPSTTSATSTACAWYQPGPEGPAIDLAHDFQQVETLSENDRTLYTITPLARKEPLKRLLTLNPIRHAEEGTAIHTKNRIAKSGAVPESLDQGQLGFYGKLSNRDR